MLNFYMDSISTVIKATQGYNPNIKKPMETLFTDFKAKPLAVMR